MLGSPILCLKGMRAIMFQLSGFYRLCLKGMRAIMFQLSGFYCRGPAEHESRLCFASYGAERGSPSVVEFTLAKCSLATWASRREVEVRWGP